MAINGKIGGFDIGVERASTGAHGPVIRTDAIDAGTDTYPVGLIMADGGAGKAVPYAAATAEAVGTGDATAATFTATLALAPAQPGALAVTDGVETFADDGHGRLTGDAGGSGWIDYKSGSLSVTFAAAPAEDAAITAAYGRKIAGVLDEAVDASHATSVNLIVHGTVKSALLKANIAGDAPSGSLLRTLRELGVYPV
ncbi:MAG: hypothetical protein PWQ57_904 [Desulfovibrionales bacterium]|nr:hypothetical protein [Desulfovibrionales bacterium]